MINTSESLRKKDGDLENYHYKLEDGEKYQLSDSEKGWLNFIAGKYSIYDHIMDNSECDDNGNLIYTMDTIGMSEALKDDNYSTCKAVCLNDDTVLQSIIFYSSIND